MGLPTGVEQKVAEPMKLEEPQVTTEQPETEPPPVIKMEPEPEATNTENSSDEVVK